MFFGQFASLVENLIRHYKLSVFEYTYLGAVIHMYNSIQTQGVVLKTDWNDKEEWRESVREIRASIATSW